MDQIICTSLSHTHYWYEVGTLKVPACVCVCVCCDPIYSGRQACGRASRGHIEGRSHRISPSFFCGACLYFSREKD